ncbi:serine/threonine-protein kinase [Streptomyces sp. NBC_01210]|uniref:protein kinase domain-containing protein n=1 Tax=Streptomyces sp. NBC_01210 TaxID=2903774 RepID=UPI002E140211|nr:serine/threonine-protein kinase [Streptomyces sp. NBC_01210]
MPSPLTHDDPAQLGAYRLIARLGSGGMGTVYLARSAGGRTVALKTMHAGIASDPASRTRFRLETDAARIIGGHHGATVVDADPFAETPWLATEYVLGPPLDDAVSIAGPLPEASVRALGAALAGALAQLHSSDVVHRDLKPSNVMVTAYGPKIIDFGIARAAGDDRLTRTGAAAGTPAFMSPEQATGQEHTPAGDVFALAGVLTYAATGHGPFGAGQAADLLYRVRYADPDLTGLPDALTPILTRCLSKDPAHRPTTTEVAAQLHNGEGQFADHLPDTVLFEIARRASMVWYYQPHRLPVPQEFEPPAPSGMSRRKLLTIGGGSALGMAAAGIGAWAWSDKQHADDDASHDEKADNGPSAVWSVDVADKWQRQLPMPVGNTVATLSDVGLLGLDPKTGKQRWSYPLLDVGQQIASDGTAIYGFIPEETEGEGLTLSAFSAANGTLERRIGHFAEFSGSVHDVELLTAADGVLYLIAWTGPKPTDFADQAKGWRLLAVDIRTGKKLWQRPHGMIYPDNGSSAVSAKAVGKVLVTASNGIPSPDFSVSGTDIRTGKRLWTTQMPRVRGDNSFLIPGQLAVDQQHVYIASGRVHAVRHSDGEVAWSFGEGRNRGDVEEKSRLYGPPAVKNGVVYAAEGSRGLVALNATTGKLLWEEVEDLTKDEDPRLDVPPVVGTKFVYAPVTSGISAVDLRTHKSVRSSPSSAIRFAVHEGTKMLIGADSATVTALPFE